MNRLLAFCTFILLFSGSLLAQSDWKLHSRLNYYTGEKSTEALLVVPADYQQKSVQVTLSLDGRLLFRKDTSFSESLVRLPFLLPSSAGRHSKLVVWLMGPNLDRELVTELRVLPPKPYMVKIDRFSGGLLVDDLPFYPFGFYCYSPVQPSLPEEEVVHGFNMLSPYQRINNQGLAERQRYMDRCAQLGMKVHYNLLSVAGGGGVGSGSDPGASEDQKRQLLIEEINRFKDHPALLAWYISDEPTGHGADPDSLAMTYKLIQDLDPYHPISIVFMAPMQARRFADAMDVVMADPYPIPNSPVRSVGTVTANLKKEFLGEKAVWIVPQAFGGSEHWAREPSARELRAMTWLAVVEGATGIQYFIRHGLNGFPKSVATWGECGKMALEVQEIQAWLLEGTQLPGFYCLDEHVRIGVWEHQGDLLIVAVNEDNLPKELQIKSPFGLEGSRIQVLFENRELKPGSNLISDLIDAFGTRVYHITGQAGTSRINPENLILDAGFEDISSPGVPAACYAAVGSDRGASYFLDTRMPFEGRHSLKLMTPSEGKGVGLNFFPVRLKSGVGYSLSVWARLDKNSVLAIRRNFWQRIFQKKKESVPVFQLAAGPYGSEEFELKSEWTQYKMHFQVPANGTNSIQVNPHLELLSQGTAFFDLLELYPDPLISFGINKTNGHFELSAKTSEKEGLLRYTLNGSVPDFESPILTDPISITESSRFTVGLFLHTKMVNSSTRLFSLHQAVGKEVRYANSFSAKYDAGGVFGLVDGVRGTRDYLDGCWQGFMRKNMDVIIDLGEIKRLKRMEVGCLQDHRAWIFMPTEVEFLGSVNGTDYQSLGVVANTIQANAPGALKKSFQLSVADGGYRFIRVVARNLGICPDWHNGKGQAAYLFVDEIVIE